MTSAGEATALAVRTFLAGVADARPFLDAWPAPRAARAVTPRSLPVLDWLDAARTAALPSAAALIETLAARSAELSWEQTYTEAEVGAAFLDRYGWTELIGTRGPIPSEALAAGILILGPETLYPAHAHAAEEVYVPLSGLAAWLRGGEAYVERRPGTVIHHPSWVPHAMRTGAEPLVAVYLWRGGDLAAKSRMVAPAPATEGGPHHSPMAGTDPQSGAKPGDVGVPSSKGAR